MPDQLLDEIASRVQAGQITPEQGQQIYMQGIQDGIGQPQGGAIPQPPGVQQPMRPQAAVPPPPGVQQPQRPQAQPVPQQPPTVMAESGQGQWVTNDTGQRFFLPASGQYAAEPIQMAPSTPTGTDVGGMGPLQTPAPQQQTGPAQPTAPPPPDPSALPLPSPPQAPEALPETENAIVGLAGKMKPGGSLSSNDLPDVMSKAFGDGGWDPDDLTDEELAFLMRLKDLQQ